MLYSAMCYFLEANHGCPHPRLQLVAPKTSSLYLLWPVSLLPRLSLRVLPTKWYCCLLPCGIEHSSSFPQCTALPLPHGRGACRVGTLCSELLRLHYTSCAALLTSGLLSPLQASFLLTARPKLPSSRLIRGPHSCQRHEAMPLSRTGH